ncbi:tetratricopeptide repeat protein [Mesorhizobium sp. ANAO-SY3R2]|uniref:tetratricopeptide repeat protein n=1 Tax=Mesorhizobium sp. ANAO-SY3R2 TaxID=3166644 RepID=UPI0036735ECA
MTVGKTLSGWACGVAACAILSFASASATWAAPRDFNRPPRAAAGDVEPIEARRAALFQVMLDDPGNLDAAFEYAALSSQVGDLEGAIATLERMLIFAPGLPRLQLELGVLYFRLGAYGTAGIYFDAAVSNGDVPEEVRNKVSEYQAAIASQNDASSFSGSFGIGLRYQSNANGGPASAIVNLNGLDFVLSEDARKAPDLNGFISGDFQGVFDLEAQGAEFKVNLRTYGEGYLKHDELNLAYAELAAGPSFDLNRFGLEGYTLDLYGIAGGGILAGDPLTSGLGAGVFLGVRPTLDWFYGLRGEYRHERFYDSDANPTLSDNSGDRFQGQLVSSYRLSDRLTLDLAGTVDRFEAETARNTFWQVGGMAGLTILYESPLARLPAPWSLSITNQIQRRNYDAADPMVSSAEQQTTKWTVGLTQTIPLTDDWAALLQTGYQKSWSNYDTGMFDNATLGISLTKVF